MKKNKHYVYLHFLPGESKPFYVGCGTTSSYSTTRNKKYERAYSKHCRNAAWYAKAAVADDIEVRIVFETDNYPEALKMEEKLIKKYEDHIVNYKNKSTGSLKINNTPVFALKPGTKDIVKAYASVGEASLDNKIFAPNISSTLSGKTLSAGGFGWVRQEDYDNYVVTKKPSIKKSERIVQLSLYGDYIATFESQYEAVEKLGVNAIALARCLRGIGDHVDGYKFVTYQDYIDKRYTIKPLSEIKLFKIEKVRKLDDEVVGQYEQKKDLGFSSQKMKKVLAEGKNTKGLYYYRLWVKEK